MDREHGLYSRIELVAHIVGVEQHGNHASLPVVAVDNVRLPLKVLEYLKRRLVEERETLQIVPLIEIRVSEIILVVDKIICYALFLELENAAVFHSPAEGNVDEEFKLHLLQIFLGDAAVFGHRDSHVVAQSRQSRGQRAHNIAQTACFGERSNLR